VDLLGRYSTHVGWTKLLVKGLMRLGRQVPDPRSRLISELKTLSPATATALADAYRAGATINQLAARSGVHRTTVAAHLDRHTVPRRRRGLTDEQIRDAIHLYCSGQSLARIADRHHVDPHTIRAALLRHGVAMRDTHGRER
jgi:lambda repressor-like predicted transcriptional regulator